MVPLHASFEGACRELDDDAALLIDHGVGNATDVWEGHPGGSAHSRWVEHPFGCLSTRYYGPNCTPEDRPAGPGSSAVPRAVSVHRDDFDDEGAPCPTTRTLPTPCGATLARTRRASPSRFHQTSPPSRLAHAGCYEEWRDMHTALWEGDAKHRANAQMLTEKFKRTLL